MYKRLIILSVLIVGALGGLAWLGYHSINIWVQGMEGTRLTDFVNVAEQIQQDVEGKLDTFMEQEQSRPYTDYQHYYVPESALFTQQPLQQVMPVVRSPLAGQIDNGFAYYNFQIEPDGSVVTPVADMYALENQQGGSQELNAADNELYSQVWLNTKNVEDNLIPMLETVGSDEQGRASTDVSETSTPPQKTGLESKTKRVQADGVKSSTFVKGGKSAVDLKNNYEINSLQRRDAEAQVLRQSRAQITSNAFMANSSAPDQQSQMMLNMPSPQQQAAQRPPDAAVSDESLQESMNETQVRAIRARQAASPAEQAQMEESEKELEEQIAGLRSRQVAAASAQQQSKQDSERQTQLPKQIDALQEQLSRYGRSSETEQVLSEQATYAEQAAQPAAQNGRDTRRSYQQQFEQPPTAPTRQQALDRFVSQQPQPQAPRQQIAQTQEDIGPQQGTLAQPQSDIVEIRVEPFEPIVVPSKEAENSIFGGQVFMVRKVRIEDKTLRQGFLLNEKELIAEIKESAARLVREGMSYELGQGKNGDCAYTAVLDFGFGHLLLNLLETDPDFMIRRIGQLKSVYFSIITVVLLAVTLALGGLWHNARAQVKLAQKKDDFISAVSHELRTPLTSIRMYSEMLEKNWVKSKDKVGEYYKNMRQESERLSRLIENVLDFSRIQRGRKRYSFSVGDLNKCVGDVVEMMRPYAAQHGFAISSDLSDVKPAPFDSDAVTQIVVNLLDNAIKYARNAEDRMILVRTRPDDGYVLIEVEDHGPGVPHRQKKKIFDEFYRIGSESTRETAGTGLGLALVKRFAEAHDGFVQILNARPNGAIFRVALSAQA